MHLAGWWHPFGKCWWTSHPDSPGLHLWGAVCPLQAGFSCPLGTTDAARPGSSLSLSSFGSTVTVLSFPSIPLDRQVSASPSPAAAAWGVSPSGDWSTTRVVGAQPEPWPLGQPPDLAWAWSGDSVVAWTLAHIPLGLGSNPGLKFYIDRVNSWLLQTAETGLW